MEDKPFLMEITFQIGSFLHKSGRTNPLYLKPPLWFGTKVHLIVIIAPPFFFGCLEICKKYCWMVPSKSCDKTSYRLAVAIHAYTIIYNAYTIIYKGLYIPGGDQAPGFFSVAGSKLRSNPLWHPLKHIKPILIVFFRIRKIITPK